MTITINNPHGIFFNYLEYQSNLTGCEQLFYKKKKYLILRLIFHLGMQQSYDCRNFDFEVSKRC